MRVLSKDYQEQLKKIEIYQFIVNHPKPDFKELEKECSAFEKWIYAEHKKEREHLREFANK